jgi:predicted GIY-YIG superfamily endonuclease
MALLRDRLLARMAGMGGTIDYVRLAHDVLGIRNTPAQLARRLVEQALVVEDRREAWLRTGERICAQAPQVPGVYVLRDMEGRALYVGKANDLRRRLRTHFAARRWRYLKPEFARAVNVEWHQVGSEVEALLFEARWIRDLAPVANVQIAAPTLDTRAVPVALLRDTILILPSIEEAHAQLLAVRMGGPVLLMSAARFGGGLVTRATTIRRFFNEQTPVDSSTGERPFDGLAPLVFSWLAGRGAVATRLDPHDVPSVRELARRLEVLLADDGLFTERIVVIRSGVLSTPTRP